MEVGGEVGTGGKDAAVLLAFAFAEELFPPFGDVMQFGMEIGKNLHGVSLAIERRACGGIPEGGIVGTVGTEAPHGGGSGEQGFRVESGGGYGQQPDWGEQGETPAYIVGDGKSAVTFLLR